MKTQTFIFLDLVKTKTIFTETNAQDETSSSINSSKSNTSPSKYRKRLWTGFKSLQL